MGRLLTDDMGLHWQIDNNLHLHPPDEDDGERGDRVAKVEVKAAVVAVSRTGQPCTGSADACRAR
ncbi:MAG: hypothetical protein ACLQFR_02885 [Streptosporangiaceae bacterium]